MSNKTHFLFGQEAVASYEQGICNEQENTDVYGIDAVKYGDENNRFTYDTFEFIEGETNPSTLLNRYDGWQSWTVITESEYDEI